MCIDSLPNDQKVTKNRNDGDNVQLCTYCYVSRLIRDLKGVRPLW